MASSRMGEFWDDLARENPYFFVDNRLDYDSPDLDRFWADGEANLDTILDYAGVAIEPSDTVVEIGCGVGRLTRPIAARAARAVALDVSREMLDLAKTHNPALDNVIWLEGDGTSLAGVDDGSASACLSHVVFQHIPDPRVTLGYVREMARVLRPGGWAAFQVSNDPSAHRPRPAQRLRRLLAPRRGPSGQADPEWLGSAVDLDELRRAADSGGMQVERVIGEGTQWCLVVGRRRTPS